MIPWRFVALGVAGLAAVGCAKSDSTVADSRGVLDPYLQVGAKLAADDVEGLAPLAKSVAEQATGSGPGMEQVRAGAGELAGVDLQAARVAFRTMSAGMLAHLASDPKTRAGLMAAHCPMTFDGDGAYWVQEAGKIDNPYEGSRMPHCGSKVDWTEAAERSSAAAQSADSKAPTPQGSGNE